MCFNFFDRPSTAPDDQMAESIARAARLVRQTFLGLAWFLLLAYVIAALTDSSILLVLSVLLVGALACGVLALYWLVRPGRDGAARRFTIATLLVATFYAAVFLAGVRWFVAASVRVRLIPGSDSAGLFLTACFVFFVLLVISIPFVLGLLDSLAWLAAWLVRRPGTRRWLAECRRR